MLKISSIRIEGLATGCVTDRQPNISFTLESDVQGEALEKARISIGNWSRETRDQVNNLYDGEMKPFTVYEVHIEATGTSGQTASGVSAFTAGRLGTPWQAGWITDTTYDFPDKTSPVPMTFRRKFPVSKPLRRAWVNATALGVYELTLNGDKIGQDYFSPGFTSYGHQIQYQTYDLLPYLKQVNEIVAVVAGGWAAGSFTHHRVNKINADRQALLCEIHLEFTDGTSSVIGSDEAWDVSLDGNYRMAEWYDGETCDATVDLSEIAWKPAMITSPRGTPALVAEYGSPVRVQAELKPMNCLTSPSGELIYDFGQNFAGVILAQIKGKRGQTIVFRHAEVLTGGELFVKSLRTAKATATYICIDGGQSYSPRLTYMGFRYVGVSGISQDDLELTALVLHSDLVETGHFECSNPLLNQLHSNIRWGGKSNFVDIPTDCPQRDEREGWTGDLAVFASTACYNFDLSRFLDKWLLDMKAEQSKGGGIPMVVPKSGDKWPTMTTSCWGDSCIIVPWAEYLARGNRQLLERQYPVMKKFLRSVRRWAAALSFTPDQSLIWRLPFHFGDWCAPDENIQQWFKKGPWVGTAYFANSCGIMADIADILGKPDDAAFYRKLRRKIIKAYRNVFTDGAGRLKKEFQTAYVLPLRFGMTEGLETASMADNLARLVKDADFHLTTGFTGTPHLLFALSDHGHAEAAFKLLLQESCPSWLYEVKAGGTTIWERWDALRPDGTVNIADLTGKKSEEESGGGMVSFNHYANGAVGDWLYQRIAGIEPTSGGYKTFNVAPLVGGGISYAHGSVATPYGEIKSRWSIEDKVFRISVSVPVSAECTLVLPNQERHVLGSGKYDFSVSLSE